MNELALFAGAGGGILGSHLLGWRTVCAVEIDDYARSVLLARQNDGSLRPFPVWDDITTFDGKPWRGSVGVVSGGFPCQDISVAGKGAGIDGQRSGLWREMFRVIGEVRPEFAFIENSPALTRRGLRRVVGDLAALGYGCRWDVLGASDIGAPHRRERLWIVAHTTAQRSAPGNAGPARGAERNASFAFDGGAVVGNADGQGLEKRNLQPGNESKERRAHQGEAARGTGWWATEPDLGRVADGVADRVDRLRAIGNGQVPRVAAEAWLLLTHNARNHGLPIGSPVD